MRHRLAGTAIDVRNGLKTRDPKRLAIYFIKHSSPNLHGDKEYQHIDPEAWRSPGHGPGRFWGVFTDSRRRLPWWRSLRTPLPWCRARPRAWFRAAFAVPALWRTVGFGDVERSAIKAGWLAATRW